MRDMIQKYRSPLGVPLTTNAGWCKNGQKSHPKVVYSGALYVTMGVVSKASRFLPLLLRNPTKEARVKLLGKFAFFSKLFLWMPFFRDRKLASVPRRALQILHSLGYNDIGCLDIEPYSGVLLYDLGFEEELIEYGHYLRDFFTSRKVEEIVLLDPHTYELFTTVYANSIPGFSFKIRLILDMFTDHLDTIANVCSNRKRSTNGGELTYHDPCIYAKRLPEKIIVPPRRILESIEGVEVKEAFNHGRTAKCCGGPLEFLFADLSKEIAKMRYSELEETGANEIIVSCPICYINFKKVRRKGTDVTDLIDFLHKNMELT
jgi:Fe-S oxidoreductase